MSGIFITTELEGELAERIHALQMGFDPKMGRYLPPHITLVGSSGCGPVPPDTPVALLKEKILPIAASTAPITLRFGTPERFVQREIVSFRLDPHGPLRALHERLKTCGLPFLQSRYPFTPHCTINLHPTLTAANLKKMLAVREDEPFTVHTLCVYHTREPQPPTLLFKAQLDVDAQLLRAGDVDALPAKPATARIAYGTDALQFGDLRLPEGRGPFPVAIVIHGGCWVTRYASLVNSTPLSDALRDAGVATWNIEYRCTDSPGGGWPNTFIDVAMGAEHLREIARQYPLDLSRVITIGHSAGGHLALWLAAAAERKVPAGSPIARGEPLALRAAIGLAGIADLADFRTYSANSCGDVVDAFMGGTPDEVPDRYAAGSPAQLLPLRTPQVQIVGTADRVMPERARNAHASSVRASGSPMELIVIPGAGHHELMSPQSAAWPVIRDAVLRALNAAK